MSARKRRGEQLARQEAIAAEWHARQAAGRSDLEAVSPEAALEALGAVYSPDFDAYASGRLPVSAVRCLMCGQAPCECEARGLTFGSAAYFARLDEIHGRTRPTARRTCSAPECPLTGRVGEHPAGLAVSGNGGELLGGESVACIAEVTR